MPGSWRPHARRRTGRGCKTLVHPTKKGNQWFFGVEGHAGADVGSGLVGTMVGTPANVHGLTVAGALRHGPEIDIHAGAEYQWVERRGIAPEPTEHGTMQLGRRRLLEAGWAMAERVKAQVRAEHPFRVVTRQFGYVQVRYRVLARTMAHVVRLLALAKGIQGTGNGARAGLP